MKQEKITADFKIFAKNLFEFIILIGISIFKNMDEKSIALYLI